MSRHTTLLFTLALIAALLGFGGLLAAAAGIAQWLFFVFVALAIASALYRLISSV